MKWMTTDIDTYLQSKEYVDTAIIPIVSIEIGQQMKNTVLNGEFITIVGNEIERQFKGRMFLLPSFTYIKNSNLEQEISRLLVWKELLIEQGFKHVIFLTSEPDWKKYKETFEDKLFCIQAVPIEHVDSSVKQQIMTDQVSQLVPLIVTAWRS